MDTNQFLDTFLEEAADHLESLSDGLLQLEKHPRDKDTLNEIFRVSHTLKGMAATMGFIGIAELVHEMESLLDGIRKEKLKVHADLIDLLFECLDRLQVFITNIDKKGPKQDMDNSSLIKRLHKLQGKESVAKKYTGKDGAHQDIKMDDHEVFVINKARQQGYNCFMIEISLNKDCMLKSARAFIIFNTLEKKGDIIKSVPSVEDIEDEKFDRTIKLVIITGKDQGDIEKSLDSISGLEEIKVREVYIPEEKEDIHFEEVQDGDYVKERSIKSITGKTVRVDIDRLDNLMNLVSELIIIKTRLEEDRDNRGRAGSDETLEYLERITTNLHDAVMKVRMVPIERIFNRFPRMVRDLSKELGKDTRLLMYGEKTEVDRTVIDEIGDPLIHLIRNSIDHGIEPIEERKKLNKTPAGRIVLRAFHDGNTVVIEVEDDGKGIDTKRIKEKLIQMGRYEKQQIETFSEEELIEQTFLTGFTTVGKVSDLSGRGVGLDVVKTKIEGLGGTMEVENRPGQGCKFIIRLPLTLAIIQALLVNVADQCYAIPLNTIKEIVTVKRAGIKNVQNKEAVLLRGKVLPIIRLTQELGFKDKTETDGEMTMVVVRKGEKLAGAIVDRLIGQQEIVIKSLGKYLSGIRYIAGATILGDGKVSLILDINPFL